MKLYEWVALAVLCAGRVMAEETPPSPVDLGFTVQDKTEANKRLGPAATSLKMRACVVVNSVDPYGPAANILRADTAITSVGGIPTPDIRSFQAAVATLKPGKQVEIKGLYQLTGADGRSQWRTGSITLTPTNPNNDPPSPASATTASKPPVNTEPAPVLAPTNRSGPQPPAVTNTPSPSASQSDTPNADHPKPVSTTRIEEVALLRLLQTQRAKFYSSEHDIHNVLRVIVQPAEESALNLAWLEQLTSLERAEVDASKRTTLDHIPAQSGMNAFLGENTEITPQVLRELAVRCPKINALAFRTPKNAETAPYIDVLENLPNLRVLCVSVQRPPPVAAFCRLKALECLSIGVRENTVGISQATLQSLGMHPTLKCLILQNIYLGGRKSNPFDFALLKGLPQLDTFVIGSSGGDESRQEHALKSLAMLTQVKGIWLTDGSSEKQYKMLTELLPGVYKGDGHNRGSPKLPTYRDSLVPLSDAIERIGFDGENTVVFMPTTPKKTLTPFELGEAQGRKYAETLHSQIEALGPAHADSLYRDTFEQHVLKAEEDIRLYPHIPAVSEQAAGFLKGFNETYKFRRP